MDVVESGNRNIEVCVVAFNGVRFLSEAEIDALTKA